MYQVGGYRVEFEDIEALLTASAFIIGKNNNDLREQKFKVTNNNDLREQKFKVTNNNDLSEITTTYNGIEYLFRVLNLNMLIEQTVLNITARGITAQATYQNHQIWDEQHTFPQTISLTLTSPRTEGTATISINQLIFDQTVDIAPCNLKKYQQTALINLIK